MFKDKPLWILKTQDNKEPLWNLYIHSLQSNTCTFEWVFTGHICGTTKICTVMMTEH